MTTTLEGTPTEVEGSLQLDKTEIDVQQCVKVYWNFSLSSYVPNSRDTVGVFEVGKNHSWGGWGNFSSCTPYWAMGVDPCL